MEIYRTAGRLIVLRPCLAAGRLVTSLQEHQRHWQFALQFVFAALHGQQPRPPFRAQAPLHGQETSTEPWSYGLKDGPRMANFNKKNWCWNENVVDQHFHLPRNARKDFRVPLRQQPTHWCLLPWNLPNQWIHLIPYRIITCSIVWNRIILTSSPN